MRVNIRVRDRDRVRFVGGQRKSVPREPDESSPVRSAGLGFLKSIRPGRDDRRMLGIAEPRAKPKAECFYRPSRDGLVFLLHFPALRTGLLSLSPSGTKVLTTLALQLTRPAAAGPLPKNGRHGELQTLNLPFPFGSLALFNQFPKAGTLFELFIFGKRQLGSEQAFANLVFMEDAVHDDTFRATLEVDPIIVGAITIEFCPFALDHAECFRVQMIQIVGKEPKFGQQL